MSHSGRLPARFRVVHLNGDRGKLWGIKTRKSSLHQQEILRTGHVRMTLDRACRINEGGQSDKWYQICCCRPNPNGCMFCTGRTDGACEGEADVASRGGTENYRSACAVVQREFSANLSVAPSVMLVLGADKNEVEFGQQEIRLKK